MIIILFVDVFIPLDLSVVIVETFNHMIIRSHLKNNISRIQNHHHNVIIQRIQIRVSRSTSQTARCIIPCPSAHSVREIDLVCSLFNSGGCDVVCIFE